MLPIPSILLQPQKTHQDMGLPWMPESVIMVDLIMISTVLLSMPLFIEHSLGENNLAAFIYPSLQYLHKIYIVSLCVARQTGIVKFHLGDRYWVTSLGVSLLNAEDMLLNKKRTSPCSHGFCSISSCSKLHGVQLWAWPMLSVTFNSFQFKMEAKEENDNFQR